MREIVVGDWVRIIASPDPNSSDHSYGDICQVERIINYDVYEDMFFMKGETHNWYWFDDEIELVDNADVSFDGLEDLL